MRRALDAKATDVLAHGAAEALSERSSEVRRMNAYRARHGREGERVAESVVEKLARVA